MPNESSTQDAPSEPNEIGDRREAPPAEKSILDRLIEIKGWIGLGTAVVSALATSVGWMYAFFAKTEEVNALSCKLDAETRTVKDLESIRLITNHQIQLTGERKNLKQKIERSTPTANNDDTEKLIELANRIKATKENLKILSDDATEFSDVVEGTLCESPKVREKYQENFGKHFNTKPKLVEEPEIQTDD